MAADARGMTRLRTLLPLLVFLLVTEHVWGAPKLKRMRIRRRRSGLGTVRAKLFFIGPNKSGTSTLYHLMQDHYGLKACHNSCAKEGGGNKSFRWARTPRNEEGVQLLALYDSYADDGDRSDYRWLARAFPTARFALNTRALEPWLLSRSNHRARARAQNHCIVAHGDSNANFAGCKGRGEFDNSLKAITGWVLKESQRQQKILAFFNSSSELLNRFAVLNVPEQPTADVLTTIDWLLRPDLARRNTSRMVWTVRDVPGSQMRRLVNQDARSVHRNAKTVVPTPAVTCMQRRVRTLLEVLGCAAYRDDAVYARCEQSVRIADNATRARAVSQEMERAFQIRLSTYPNASSLLGACVAPPPLLT